MLAMNFLCSLLMGVVGWVEVEEARDVISLRQLRHFSGWCFSSPLVGPSVTKRDAAQCFELNDLHSLSARGCRELLPAPKPCLCQGAAFHIAIVLFRRMPDPFLQRRSTFRQTPVVLKPGCGNAASVQKHRWGSEGDWWYTHPLSINGVAKGSNLLQDGVERF